MGEVLLSPKEVANLLKVEVETLQKWRSVGKGPKYIKITPKIVRYYKEEIDDFIKRGISSDSIAKRKSRKN